jgi:hypothetical protein
MAKKKEKTIVSQKTHTFKVIEYSDGSVAMQRENDGFTALELLGYMSHIQLDIQERFAKLAKPDSVERIVIKRRN